MNKGSTVIMLVALLFIAGCEGTLPQKGHTIIDWVDFVKINDIQYHASYSAVIADETFIGEKIGEVAFNVDDNITNPSYDIKNGDAAYLEEGTNLYLVKAMPGYIAVKDPYKINGYKLYLNKDYVSRDVPLHFKNIDMTTVTKIEIYDGAREPQLLNALSDQEDVSALVDILANGEVTSRYTPNTSKGDPDRYQIIFYHSMPIAYYNTLFNDGEEWYGYDSDTAILSDDISKFVE
ncbi:hypothetical protein [Lentibacillus saliphilus]|uniref:hypothetical protein n=1 Tax=Lentibacillus saliphilus TaxID=2737028 RepID=UPI001C3096D7|nr:hypothetical protein [Lentibacillus saliphilus]